MTFKPERLVLLEGGETSWYHWTVSEPLTWTGKFRDGAGQVKVPAQFETDLASVPRFMTWLFPRYGKYTKAAVVHDYLCQNIGDFVFSCSPDRSARDLQPIRIRDRSDADEVFRHVMRELEVPPPSRWLMWSAVTWATLTKSMWPLRKTDRHLQIVGLLTAIVAVLTAAASAAVLLVQLVTGDSGWKWVLAVGILCGAFIAAGIGVFVGGFVAQGRGDRWAIDLFALALTLAFFPFLLAGVGVGLLGFCYMGFEMAVSSQARAKHRSWKRSTKAPAAPERERQEALQAV